MSFYFVIIGGLVAEPITTSSPGFLTTTTPDADLKSNGLKNGFDANGIRTASSKVIVIHFKEIAY